MYGFVYRHYTTVMKLNHKANLVMFYWSLTFLLNFNETWKKCQLRCIAT